MEHTDTARSAALMPGERCPAPCPACGDALRCEWCGHPIIKRAHYVRMAGAIFRRHCDRCPACEAVPA